MSDSLRNKFFKASREIYSDNSVKFMHTELQAYNASYDDTRASFDWGNTDAGSKQLASAILKKIGSSTIARVYANKYMNEVIKNITRDNWTLEAIEVARWINDYTEYNVNKEEVDAYKAEGNNVVERESIESEEARISLEYDRELKRIKDEKRKAKLEEELKKEEIKQLKITREKELKEIDEGSLRLKREEEFRKRDKELKEKREEEFRKRDKELKEKREEEFKRRKEHIKQKHEQGVLEMKEKLRIKREQDIKEKVAKMAKLNEAITKKKEELAQKNNAVTLICVDLSITEEEFAKILDVTIQTIKEWKSKNEIPHLGVKALEYYKKARNK